MATIDGGVHLQRRVAHLLSPLWLPLLTALMRWGLGWRIVGLRRARRTYQRLRSESRAPLLVCANHLTMVDSALVAWALGSPWWYLRHFDAFPWNVPERANFASTWWQRAAMYLFKCLPIRRGGERSEVAGVLGRLAAVLSEGDVALVFPEGGRSRSGRVDTRAATYGVGRVVKAVPGCRVLCVYLRGEHQTTWSRLPARGERFRVALSCIEPRSESAGLRGSLEITRQVVEHLALMESGTTPATAAAS